MILPKSIRVGAHDIHVSEMSQQESQGARHFGLFAPTASKIKVATHTAPIHVLDTMLHEVIHAIWWDRIFSNDATEENAVSAISAGMTQVLRDNPKLRKWIEDMIKLQDKRQTESTG